MEGEYKHSIQKVHNKEYLIKNACYSVTKYYLCKQNNKRSLLGRKQQSQVARSFPNRYQFSCTNKVTSLFSMSCILRIILHRNYAEFASPYEVNRKSVTVKSSFHCVITPKPVIVALTDSIVGCPGISFVPRRRIGLPFMFFYITVR